MNDTGQDIRAALLAGSGDVPPGLDLLRGVREQAAARRRHRRRARVLGPAAAAAAAAAAMLAGTSVTGPPPALAAVTSAMADTAAQSYRFTMTGSLTLPSAGLIQHFALTGAIDPRHERGTELLTGGPLRGTRDYVTEQLRFLGKDLYTWVSPGSGLGSAGQPWDEAPIPAPGPRAWPGSELRGNQQGRVRSLDTITTLRTSDRNPPPTETEDLTFGSFSAPVQVTAPPASQVTQTPTPHWEFGF